MNHSVALLRERTKRAEMLRAGQRSCDKCGTEKFSLLSTDSSEGEYGRKRNTVNLCRACIIAFFEKAEREEICSAEDRGKIQELQERLEKQAEELEECREEIKNLEQKLGSYRSDLQH